MCVWSAGTHGKSYCHKRSFGRRNSALNNLFHHQTLWIWLTVKGTPSKGRPPKLSKKQQQQLKIVVDRVGVSQRQLAKYFSVSRFCILRNLKKKQGIKYDTRQKAPKYDEKQLDQLPKRCRKLRQVVASPETSIILDDEEYYMLSDDNMSRNVGFYKANKANNLTDVKFSSEKKFEVAHVVWQRHFAITHQQIKRFCYQWWGVCPKMFTKTIHIHQKIPFLFLSRNVRTTR